MSGGFPHVHLGPRAEAEPDEVPRSYRLSVLIASLTEAEGVAVAREAADALAARGIALREGDDTVRAMIALEPHAWPTSMSDALTEELAGAQHIVVPKSVPQAPDLAQDYSPN